MTEDQIRRVLRDMREEPVPPDSLARVRLAVSERRKAKARVPWLGALVAAAALAVLFFTLPPPPAQPPVPVVAMRPAPVVIETKPDPAAQPLATKAALVKKSKPRPESADTVVDPLVVRIETDDPDVVIVLVGD